MHQLKLVGLASRKIRNVAGAMRLSEVVSGYATRLYTLAVEIKFTKGRKNMNVVAACLYIACRKKETKNYMLIDLSDLLQVSATFYLLLIFVLKDSRSMSLNSATPFFNSSKPSNCQVPSPWWTHLTTSPASQHSSNSATTPTKSPPTPCASPDA